MVRKLFIIPLIVFCAGVAFGQQPPPPPPYVADIMVSKSGPESTAADSDVTYTVTVFNLGPDTATSVTLIDTIPDGMTFVSVTPNATCTGPAGTFGNQMTCTIADLAANGSAIFTFVFHTSVEAGPGDFFTNVATAATIPPEADPNEENNSASATTVIPISQSDAAIVKNGPSVAGPNTDVSYTITVTNSGADASPLSWQDTLPGTMTFVSLTQNSGPTMTCGTPAVGSGGTISCTITTFAAGATATFTLTGHIPGTTTSGALQNTATVAAPNDPNGENNASTTTLTVSSVDLSVVKSGPATAAAGTPFSYTITIANGGPDAATAVVLSDTLPPNTTFVSLTQNTGPAAACSTPLAGSDGTVWCGFGTLGSGQSAQFTLTIVAGNTASVTNTATVNSENYDPDPSDNTSSVTTTITPVADLAITKSGPAAATPGTNFSYTITAVNNGPTNASNVVINDAFPPGTTFVSVVQNSGPAFVCTPGVGSVACTAATFPAGATATFTLVLHLDPSVQNGTPIANTATISATTSDPDSTNNSSTTGLTAAPTADLSVTKTGPATVVRGSNITYSVTITNNGPSNAANVTLTDTLPPLTTFVSATQTSGPTFNCTNTATTITCTIASFAAGASASFDFVLHVSADATGTISNTVRADSATVDPSPGNSSATSAAAVQQAPDAPLLSPAALALLAVALGFAGVFVARRG